MTKPQPFTPSVPVPLSASAPTGVAAIVPALVPALVAALVAPPPAEASAPPAQGDAHTQADAAPSQAVTPSVRVVVDASALGPDGGWFEDEIAKRYTEALTAEGFTVDAHGQATVRITLDYFDAEDRDFLIATDVVHDGRMAVSQRPTKCPACIDTELVDASVAQLPELIASLRATPAQLPSDPGTGPGPESGVPAGSGPGAEIDTGEPGEPPRAIGPLGGVGIGVAAVGVGLTVWGAVELSRGIVYAGGSDSLALYREGVDHRPRGRALVGVGVGAFVVGGAVLVTDLVLRRKQRKQSRTLSAAPVVTGDFVGLGWSGRF